MNKIEKARNFADNLWSQAYLSWNKRQQDHNYRQYLARPAICQALRELNLRSKLVVVDLGCAEGIETIFIARILRQMDLEPKVYGFDPYYNGRRQKRVADIIFERGELTKLLSKYHLQGKVDLLTSIFVLQELPSWDKFLIHICHVLKPGGRALFLFVHPDFGLALKRKSALIINKELSQSADWEFAAAYPIVEEKGRTFYLPYFHRSLDVIKKKLEKHFCIQKIRGLKPNSETIKYCRQEKISPFINHFGNIYWPEIISQESSLLIIASKKEEK